MPAGHRPRALQDGHRAFPVAAVGRAAVRSWRSSSRSIMSPVIDACAPWPVAPVGGVWLAALAHLVLAAAVVASPRRAVATAHLTPRAPRRGNACATAMSKRRLVLRRMISRRSASCLTASRAASSSVMRQASWRRAATRCANVGCAGLRRRLAAAAADRPGASRGERPQTHTGTSGGQMQPRRSAAMNRLTMRSSSEW